VSQSVNTSGASTSGSGNQSAGTQDRRVGWLTFVSTILGLTAAVLTVVTAILGAQKGDVTAARDDLQRQVWTLEDRVGTLTKDKSSLESENTALKKQISQLQGANASLTKQVADLKAQLRGTPGGGETNPPPQPEFTVRHQGRLDLVKGRANQDLDAPSTDPQWAGTGQGDFTLSPTGDFESYKNLEYLGTEKASYKRCSESQLLVQDKIDSGRMTPGSNICMKTNERRYAALHVVAVTGTQVTMQAIVYDPPDTN
jgi:hypothetical protein